MTDDAVTEIRRELDAHPTWNPAMEPRRNESTHPRELPNPADEAAAFQARLWDADRAALTRVAAQPWSDGDPCSLCGEDETDDDPIAHFVAPDNSTYVMAHGQCGVDHGLRLA